MAKAEHSTIPPRLSVRGVKKAFGANVVLRGIDLELPPGEIHALVGGNGAGKSTLSKIIAGLQAADAGEVEIDGSVHRPRNRREGQAAGVVMVLQELSVLPTLTVAENLFLGALPQRFGGVVDRVRLHRAAQSALERVGLGHLDPETPAANLGVGHQQLVEIAAGLAQRCQLLILDEPTAALTGAEIERLFVLLRELQRGGTAILYISHRLDEIAALAHRVSVLRDGQLIATRPAREATRDELIELMAGRAMVEAEHAPARPQARELALRVTDLRVAPAMRGVSFELHRGEILGLGGLVGAGRTELLRALFGADPNGGGEIRLGPDGDVFVPTTTGAAMRRGFSFVPEDRKHHGLFARLSVQANASMARLPVRSWLRGALDSSAEETEVRGLLEQLQVRYASAEQPIGQLSGGNQQKVIIGRWLRRDVRVWLLDEPTRGVDAAARHAIYGLLRARAAAGESLIVASSDYDELAVLCDRVLVLSNGRLTGEFTRETLTPAAFTAAAFRGFGQEVAA